MTGWQLGAIVVGSIFGASVGMLLAFAYVALMH